MIWLQLSDEKAPNVDASFWGRGGIDLPECRAMYTGNGGARTLLLRGQIVRKKDLGNRSNCVEQRVLFPVTSHWPILDEAMVHVRPRQIRSEDSERTRVSESASGFITPQG